MRQEETEHYYDQNKFLDYKFSSKPADDSVKTTIDPSVIRMRTKSDKQIARERRAYQADRSGLEGESRLSRLGGSSELGKLQRIADLKAAVKAGKVVTVTSATKFSAQSRATVTKYAEEGGFSLLDDKLGKWVGKVD